MQQVRQPELLRDQGCRGCSALSGLESDPTFQRLLTLCQNPWFFRFCSSPGELQFWTWRIAKQALNNGFRHPKREKRRMDSSLSGRGSAERLCDLQSSSLALNKFFLGRHLRIIRMFLLPSFEPVISLAQLVEHIEAYDNAVVH